jgi:hypothetical protein
MIMEWAGGWGRPRASTGPDLLQAGGLSVGAVRL